jgi:hypothetical protein
MASVRDFVSLRYAVFFGMNLSRSIANLGI